MAYLKFTPDLFLGKQELTKMQRFIIDRQKLFLRFEGKTWGIIKNGTNALGTNFQVNLGTNPGTVRINNFLDSYAVDSDGNIITKRYEDNIAIPDDSSWRWLRISYQETTIEEGVVSIDASGNLTGIGTKFTDVLRGLPDAPSKIKFSGSTLNLNEYEVVDVVNETTAVLVGNFSPESNLHYRVVGTFTPGQSILEANKFPFVNDGCLLELVTETTTDTPPAKTTNMDTKQFYIARVQNTSGTVTIQDKRSLNVFTWRYE